MKLTDGTKEVELTKQEMEIIEEALTNYVMELGYQPAVRSDMAGEPLIDTKTNRCQALREKLEGFSY